MIDDSSWLYRRFWGIRVYEYLWIGGLYFFSAFSYHLTLWINATDWREESSTDNFFDPVYFMDTAGLDYLIKLALTIPLWWLLFRKLKHVSLARRLALHLVALPLFIILFIGIYYGTSRLLHFGILVGWARVWDIYIPALFYILQFAIFHAYAYYRENQEQMLRQAALKEAALKSELSALKAQLNPHFLYNVFNTISASVPPENEHTRDLIAKLSDLFRYQLKASREELVPLREELTFVEQYLELEKARFEDRLTIEIDIPDFLRDALVPPMLLQPLVENAIKHGLTPLVEGGKITVRAREKGELIAFEIIDTGLGIADKKDVLQRGVGLSTTNMRLEKLYGRQLQLSDNFPRGLKIAFEI